MQPDVHTLEESEMGSKDFLLQFKTISTFIWAKCSEDLKNGDKNFLIMKACRSRWDNCERKHLRSEANMTKINSRGGRRELHLSTIMIFWRLTFAQKTKLNENTLISGTQQNLGKNVIHIYKYKGHSKSLYYKTQLIWINWD